MIFAVSELAGWLQPPAEAVHIPFGNVLGTDGKMLRSRSGDPVALRTVIDEAIERGIAVVAAKYPELPADLRQSIGHAVGVGALKYADLSTDRVTDYVFDWDRMLSFDGNTAPYLQYAHTRICSLFRRAGVDRDQAGAALVLVEAPQERTLALRLLGYEGALVEAVGRYSPHRLCTYLFELATDFTAFYEHCPVLKAPSDELRASRLAVSGVDHGGDARPRARPARHRRPRTDVDICGGVAPLTPSVARWWPLMDDLGVAEAGFARHPTLTFEALVDVEEGQVREQVSDA